MKAKLFIVILLLAMLVNGCAYSVDTENNTRPSTDYSMTVIRHIDREAGVVCWLQAHHYSGIDCMPIGETRLDQ